MEINEIIRRPIFKKWWFWVIIVVIVLGAIGFANEDDLETTDVNVVDNTATSSPKETDTFDDDFDSLCDKLTDTYSSIGTVSCQSDTLWDSNHKSSPEAFPYEYRDINIDFDGEISYEVKYVKNSDDMDYFRENYACSEIYLGDGSCIVDEAKDNIIYSIIFYNENNQEEIIKLSEGLKTILRE